MRLPALLWPNLALTLEALNRAGLIDDSSTVHGWL